MYQFFSLKIYIENCNRHWVSNGKLVKGTKGDIQHAVGICVVSSTKENNRQQSKIVTEQVAWIYFEEFRKSLNKKRQYLN